MPNTHAPMMTARSERNAVGNPEKGIRMVRTPRRMRVLVRDMSIVYRL